MFYSTANFYKMSHIHNVKKWWHQLHTDLFRIFFMFLVSSFVNVVVKLQSLTIWSKRISANEIIGVDELVIMWQVRHLVVKALTNIYLLSNFRKLPKTTIRAPSSGEMGVFRSSTPIRSVHSITYKIYMDMWQVSIFSIMEKHRIF